MRSALAILLGSLFVLWGPAAAADAPTLVVRIEGEPASLEVEPGSRTTVALSVRVEFREMTCTSEAEAGVDLVMDEGFTEWASADPEPDFETYKYPVETKAADLTVVVDAEAPRGSLTTFRLQPIFHFPAGDQCPGAEPGVDAPAFELPVRVKPGSGTVATTPGTGTGSSAATEPSIGWLGGLLAVGVALGLRRPRQ